MLNLLIFGLKQLRKKEYSNLHVGLGTVISVYNKENIEETGYCCNCDREPVDSEQDLSKLKVKELK